MTNVEGMWALLSGSNDAPDELVNGGIVVLETGRVFGGDSAMAYIGSYEVTSGLLRADVRSWMWNPAYVDNGTENVFGMSGKIDYQAVFEGTREGDVIRGHLFAAVDPATKIPAALHKITDLPG